MGMSKLNVWLRDEKCRPFIIDNPSPSLDYVRIENCLGEKITQVTMPAGQAHVEIEVPPGCYRVSGSVCERGTNEETDTAMVMAGCNQKICVNLIVPTVETCARNNLIAVATAALLAELSLADIVATTRTMMSIGNVTRDDLVNELQTRIRSLDGLEGREDRLEDYKRVSEIIEKI